MLRIKKSHNDNEDKQELILNMYNTAFELFKIGLIECSQKMYSVLKSYRDVSSISEQRKSFALERLSKIQQNLVHGEIKYYAKYIDILIDSIKKILAVRDSDQANGGLIIQETVAELACIENQIDEKKNILKNTNNYMSNIISEEIEILTKKKENKIALYKNLSSKVNFNNRCADIEEAKHIYESVRTLTESEFKDILFENTKFQQRIKETKDRLKILDDFSQTTD